MWTTRGEGRGERRVEGGLRNGLKRTEGEVREGGGGGGPQIRCYGSNRVEASVCTARGAGREG